MKALFQKQKGMPFAYAACLASLLEVGLDEIRIPEGDVSNEGWLAHWALVLGEFGLSCLSVPAGLSEWRCPGYSIVLARKADGELHPLVAYGEKVIHDPDPNSPLENWEARWIYQQMLIPMDPAVVSREAERRDLAALVRKLAWAYRRDTGKDELPNSAMDYLRRKGLLGSILRGGGA